LPKNYEEQAQSLGPRVSTEQAELRTRDVKRISSKYKVYFIHGTRPDEVNLNNPWLARRTKWRNKLDILLGFSLELSASTVRAGDGPNNMFSRLGVILRTGTVYFAQDRDAGTRTTEQGGKDTWSPRMRNLEDDIENAILHRGTSVLAWNEFIIGGDVQFAGLYVCFDRKDSDRYLETNPNYFRRINGSDLLTTDRINEVISVVQAVKMPLYVIHKGVVYEAEHGTKDGQGYIRRKGELISPESISSSNFSLSTQEMEEARDRASIYLEIKPPPRKEE